MLLFIPYFTFHYVSINTFVLRLCSVLYISLHSTMFLLIHDSNLFIQSFLDFTFHYVSINTLEQMYIECLIRSLHSTMFLLIRDMAVILDKLQAFTFHYVSINTCISDHHNALDVYTLHSTMFLLIQRCSTIMHIYFQLYIPLCFY